MKTIDILEDAAREYLIGKKIAQGEISDVELFCYQYCDDDYVRIVIDGGNTSLDISLYGEFPKILN